VTKALTILAGLLLLGWAPWEQRRDPDRDPQDAERCWRGSPAG
jgi:hypothetical protein